MKTLTFSTFVALIGILSHPEIAFAHSANDPLEEIQKYDIEVISRQKEFRSIESTEDRIKNLENQVEAMQRKILSIRHLMASDYPHIKEKMSKYKYNYVKGLDDTVKQLKSTLKQSKTILKSAE